MDDAFVDAVRDLLAALAAGGEPAAPLGGGMQRVFRETGASNTRGSVGVLVDRWFTAPTVPAESTYEPVLNRPDVGEPEKLHATLRQHVLGQSRWQMLSSNESTFYRYRRAAIAAFAERLWAEITARPFPSNRPRPEYARLVGRRAEVAHLLRLLNEPGGAVVGIEGPGGSGKTALLHAVADACESAARDWRAPTLDGGGAVPLIEAVVWAARSEGMDLAWLLDAVARTLDYPGLLARTLEDRRQAVRDLLAHRTVLLLVDDVDQAEPTVLTFLSDLPGGSRALVAARRRLPAEVRALMPAPLTMDEVEQLLIAEAERQGAPEIGRALVAGRAPEPLAAAARYPLLAGWAVGQLRRGQTVERVRERLARAEGEVFGAMFAASVAGLSPAARALLVALPLLPAPVDRATLLAAGGPRAEAALDELLETSLLEVSGAPTDADRRYELHAVTRSFVQSYLAADAGQQRGTTARLAEHYAGLSHTWGGGTPNWRTFGRLEAELPNILAVLEACSVQARERAALPPGATFDQAILGIAHGMRNVFSFGRAWAEGIVLFHRAIEAAHRLNDTRAEGWNTYRLGALHYELGTGGYAEAARRAREAADLLRTADDARGLGHALRLLGRATRDRGHLAEAERLLAEAEDVLALHGEGDDLGIVRASHADLLRASGRPEEARALYERVLAEGLEDPATEANVCNDLGEIALASGDLDAAARSFAAAELLAEAAGARAILARCFLGQAHIARARADRTLASARSAAAADLFERLGDSERAYEARAVVPPPPPAPTPP